MKTHTANDLIDVTVDVAQGFAGGKSRLVQEGIWFVAEQAVKVSAKHAHRQLEDKTPVRSGAMKRNIKTRVTRTKHGAKAVVSYEKPSNASVSYAGIVNAGGRGHGRSRVARMAAARALHHVGKRASHPAIHHVARHLSQHADALKGPHKAEHDIGFIDAAIEAGKEFMLNATVNAVVDGVVYLVEEGGVYLLEGAAIAIF